MESKPNTELDVMNTEAPRKSANKFVLFALAAILIVASSIFVMVFSRKYPSESKLTKELLEHIPDSWDNVEIQYESPTGDKGKIFYKAEVSAAEGYNSITGQYNLGFERKFLSWEVTFIDQLNAQYKPFEGLSAEAILAEPHVMESHFLEGGKWIEDKKTVVKNETDLDLLKIVSEINSSYKNEVGELRCAFLKVYEYKDAQWVIKEDECELLSYEYDITKEPEISLEEFKDFIGEGRVQYGNTSFAASALKELGDAAVADYEHDTLKAYLTSDISLEDDNYSAKGTVTIAHDYENGVGWVPVQASYELKVKPLKPITEQEALKLLREQTEPIKGSSVKWSDVNNMTMQEFELTEEKGVSFCSVKVAATSIHISELVTADMKGGAKFKYDSVSGKWEYDSASGIDASYKLNDGNPVVINGAFDFVRPINYSVRDLFPTSGSFSLRIDDVTKAGYPRGKMSLTATGENGSFLEIAIDLRPTSGSKYSSSSGARINIPPPPSVARYVNTLTQVEVTFGNDLEIKKMAANKFDFKGTMNVKVSSEGYSTEQQSYTLN